MFASIFLSSMTSEDIIINTKRKVVTWEPKKKKKKEWSNCCPKKKKKNDQTNGGKIYFLQLTVHLKPFHDREFQALRIFWERYIVALIAPAAKKPDTACLALETITLRFITFSIHLAAASLEPIQTSPETLPIYHFNHQLLFLHFLSYN